MPALAAAGLKRNMTFPWPWEAGIAFAGLVRCQQRRHAREHAQPPAKKQL